MLKRIAVIGDKALIKSLNAANEDPEVMFSTLETPDKPASGTCAVLAPAGHSRQAIECAGAIAAEHLAALNLIADAVACREEIPLSESLRVAQHASRFAKALNLSADDQFALERAALLRDVGKICIPNEVILKKSVLNYDEWALLKNHSRLGAELLLERGVSIDIVQIVEFHHECYDGDGYPDHLEREEIPYLARVMRLLDVYCAMTSPRHYRKSQFAVQEGLKYIKDERGKHFDPALVDAFLSSGIADE